MSLHIKKYTTGSLLFQQDVQTSIHNSYLVNLVPCELDLTYATFFDAKIITYDIELTPDGNKIGFNLLDDNDFTIPYIINTIQNPPAVHQLPTQAK